MLISKKGESARSAQVYEYLLAARSFSPFLLYLYIPLEQTAQLQEFQEEEGPLYGPGIADWSKIEVSSNKLQFFTIFLSRKL